MKRMIALLGLSLAGCAGTVEPQPVNIAVTTDSYCTIYSKLSWSPKDTPETVRGIINANAKYDRTCMAQVASATRLPKATP